MIKLLARFSVNNADITKNLLVSPLLHNNDGKIKEWRK